MKLLTLTKSLLSVGAERRAVDRDGVESALQVADRGPRPRLARDPKPQAVPYDRQRLLLASIVHDFYYGWVSVEGTTERDYLGMPVFRAAPVLTKWFIARFRSLEGRSGFVRTPNE